MIFEVGDNVRVHKRCRRYKTYIPEILNYKGIVVDINETYENPIIVSIEGVRNKYSKKGYFYFDEGDLIYCGGRNDILDNEEKQYTKKESNILKGKIENVIFNNPATIVFWKDGSKTVVKASNEEFDPEKGFAMAIAKKAFGNEGNYFNEFKKWLPEEDVVDVNGAGEFLRSLLRNAIHSNKEPDCTGDCDICDDTDCQNTPDEE